MRKQSSMKNKYGMHIVSAIIISLLLMVLCVPALSLSLTPSTKPEQVLQAQLDALRANDMNRVYQFASPRNKEQTGNVDRFGNMVRSGPYRYLLHHEASTILLESKMGQSWQALVRVIPSSSDKDLVEFWWSLSRCSTGQYPGCYMVDAVIPNQ